MNAALVALKAIPLWLVLALAAAGVIWWQHGQIQDARADVAALAEEAGACQAARDNLVALTTEQGKALGDLQLAIRQRQAAAEKAVADARASAQADYQAANRLQQERTGGDQCTAATSIIDKELGL
ncbi:MULTISPECIES: hypothetical protein [Pseudomonas]|uniref:Uncharacterized protein n=1 Tax=Pseudomonas juntendi TaxID=2666183 RepID=A0AAJ5V2V5_9PSED|nr:MULTISPECIES: hypothetical protein [Pseudomonas]PYB97593.1 hypothetical protein DMX12_17945 [Pseudomonas sp. MB-090624]QOH71614.1 hypothetical protein IGB31_04165 [Pseudomonas putida]WEA19907.1 hypothetical protein PWA60_22000 [Pseudomonas juntendi]